VDGFAVAHQGYFSTFNPREEKLKIVAEKKEGLIP